jgi:hypothetical protein
VPQRATAEALGIARNTIANYEREARKRGWLEANAEMPDESQVAQMLAEMFAPSEQTVLRLEPHREWILERRDAGASILKIQAELREYKQTKCAYSLLWSYVRRIEGPAVDVTVRVETEPGEECQVDFGYAGYMFDPSTRQPRKAWMFVMTLSYSRHMFVKFVFAQTTETWLRLHRDAFEFFGGVPGRVKLDNLKAAIVRGAVEDPIVQKAYRELAEHYGFVISPCRVRTPEHKGKVEAGVKYVKSNFLTGMDASYMSAERHIGQANIDVRAWTLKTAGERDHGTTHWQPLMEFERIERGALKPLPQTPYEIAVWTRTKVHRDCHIVLGGNYYSAPFRLAGTQVDVRVSDKDVQIYAEHTQVTTHTRLEGRGKRLTVPAHLPDYKLAGMSSAPILRDEAAKIGPFTALLIGTLLAERPVDKTRTAQRLIGLASKHDKAVLERACKRAHDSGDFTPATVRNMLVLITSGHVFTDNNQQQQQTPQALFARSIEEIAPASALNYDSTAIIEPARYRYRSGGSSSSGVTEVLA